MNHKPLYSYKINNINVLNNIHGYCETKFLDLVVEYISYADKIPYQFLYNIWKYPIPNLDRPTIVFMTSCEEGCPTPPEYVENPNITHIFRHYHSQETSDKVFHIPLGYVQGFEEIKRFSLRDRPLDYFFSGTLNQYDRPEMVKALQQYSQRNPNGIVNVTPGWKSGFSERTHGILLQQSKIALIPNGFTSPESFRFFEANYAGCITVSLAKPPAWYYNTAPNFIVNNWNNIGNFIDGILKDIKNNDHFLNTMSSKISHYSNYVISANSVAEYILDKINVTNK